jgi:hypothetical protein
MRFAATLTATGLLSYLVLEIAKLFMAPIVAWVIGLLTVVFKIAFIVLALGILVGVGIYFYRRSRDVAVEA